MNSQTIFFSYVAILPLNCQMNESVEIFEIPFNIENEAELFAVYHLTNKKR